jgi:1,4-alpha-glucan branching enzyme
MEMTTMPHNSALDSEQHAHENASAGLSQYDIDALTGGYHWNPFSVLGLHDTEHGPVVRAMLPGARGVQVIGASGAVLGTLHAVHSGGLFAGRVSADSSDSAGTPGQRHRLRIDWHGETQETGDAYAFGAVLHDHDLERLSWGDPSAVEACLGARPIDVDGTRGVLFAVWAPNAKRVSVVGDFNSWDGRRHPMRVRHQSGVWEIFIPGIGAGTRYKYEIMAREGHVLPLKADPVARQTERPPATASVVASNADIHWTDAEWMRTRAERQSVKAPIAIYEVHAESWMRVIEEQNRSLDWEELGDRLIPYAKSLGFTHLEFLPLAEHPFGGSWGYQPLGQFAPSARFGTPEQFARFVDRAHGEGLGVLVDWVPAHFPNDAHGLFQFDGTPLYEHADPREGYHQDWNTMIYNLGRNEVSAFMLASAISWLKRFHIDGLRVDAVASMLYRDYSRKEGEWVPNIHGGRENYESIAFLRRLNEEVHGESLSAAFPGAITIAEESTAWPGVTAPVGYGGLGFDFKWNMGWMHDTLHYMQTDSVYRRHHHHEMTFGMVYAYSERFVLPLSHDEVVHGKGSLLGRMPGDRWQRFANLRAYLGFMWAHPGKKLLFMGGELGQFAEWNHDASPHWHLLEDDMHAGIQRVVGDLNRVYGQEAALHASDSDPAGFFWLVGDDNENSVYAFARREGEQTVVVISNMTPVPREGYRIGLPHEGYWREVMNTDAALYGGSNMGNGGGVRAHAEPSHSQPWSASLTLPPLSTVILASP